MCDVSPSSLFRLLLVQVQEMRKGTECGISFEGFQAFQQGDIVQSIELVEVPRTL